MMEQLEDLEHRDVLKKIDKTEKYGNKIIFNINEVKTRVMVINS